MDVFDKVGGTPEATVEAAHAELTAALAPHKFTVPHWVNGKALQGRIDIYTRHRVGAVYINHGLAVLKAVHSTEELARILQKEGYKVCTQYVPFDASATAEAFDALAWQDIRDGEDVSAISEPIEALLTPVMQSVPGVQAYEFAVYDTAWVRLGSEDPSFLAPRPPEEVFVLPTKHGMPHFHALAEKVRATPNHALAITSRVQTAQGIRHIPMIDFRTGNDLYIDDVVASVARLGLPDQYIVDSGNSFHYYGAGTLLTNGEWREFNSKASTEKSIGDIYPHASQTQGFNMLRISPSQRTITFPSHTEESLLAAARADMKHSSQTIK
jgi:hypothetical protein